MKRKVAIILIIVVILLGIFGFYIYHLEPDLEKYTFSNQEFYEFQYQGNTYAVGDVVGEPLSTTGLFYKKHNNYYILDEISRCTYTDSSFYVKDNKVYFHCYFHPDTILEYELDGIRFQRKDYPLNFMDAPNISQLHMQFNKVDDDFIYLYSVVKEDDAIEEGNYVKCSLHDNTCEYSNGYTPYQTKLDHSFRLVYEEDSPNKEYSDNYYQVQIYQNANEVAVVVSSNTSFGELQYSIKSNKEITKDDVKIEWTTPEGSLYHSKDEEIGTIGVMILNHDNRYTDYSTRFIDVQDKSVTISNNQIIQ